MTAAGAWAAMCWAQTTCTTCATPWGSYAEYSFDIDHIPADLDWPAADHPPEDSFYVWGPAPPADFVTNFEHPAAAG